MNVFAGNKGRADRQVYLWERSNEELSLTPDVMQEISRKIQGYEQGSDYSEIRELAKQTYMKGKRITRERMLLEQEMENESGELQRLEEELTEWKTQKEPEPEQPARADRSSAAESADARNFFMFILLSICLSWVDEKCLLCVDTCSLNGYIIQDAEEKCKSKPNKISGRTGENFHIGNKRKKSLPDQRESCLTGRVWGRPQGRPLGR